MPGDDVAARPSRRNAVAGLNQSISASIPRSTRPFHMCMGILPTCNGFARLRGANFDSDDERGRTAESGSVTEGVMKDLKADWLKWSRVERTIALFIAAGTSSTVPALLLLGQH